MLTDVDALMLAEPDVLKDSFSLNELLWAVLSLVLAEISSLALALSEDEALVLSEFESLLLVLSVVLVVFEVGLLPLLELAELPDECCSSTFSVELPPFAESSSCDDAEPFGSSSVVVK